MDFPFFHKSPPDPGSRGMLLRSGKEGVEPPYLGRVQEPGAVCAMPRVPPPPKKKQPPWEPEASTCSFPYPGSGSGKGKLIFFTYFGGGEACGGPVSARLGEDVGKAGMRWRGWGWAAQTRAAARGVSSLLKQHCSCPGWGSDPRLLVRRDAKMAEGLEGRGERKSGGGVPPRNAHWCCWRLFLRRLLARTVLSCHWEWDVPPPPAPTRRAPPPPAPIILGHLWVTVRT